MLKRLAILGVFLIIFSADCSADKIQDKDKHKQPTAPIAAASSQQQGSTKIHGEDQQDIHANVKILNPPEKDFYDKAPVWINFALAIVGLVGIGIGIGTLNKIQRQADIASNSQRSWIIPKGVSEPDLSGTWIMKVSCEFEVFGSSPVRVHQSKFIFDFVPAIPVGKTGEVIPSLPDQPDYGQPDTLLDSPEMGKIWAPGNQILVHPMLKGAIAKPEQLSDLKEGKTVLCIYGFIHYRDAFDKSKMRETRFCYICGKKGVLDEKWEGHFDLGGPPAYNDIG